MLHFELALLSTCNSNDLDKVMQFFVCGWVYEWMCPNT